MLEITPYLGMLVVIVSIGGIFYPKLGYFVPLVFISLMIISPFRGRWFCGNLCPRGSFVDFWVAKISRHRKIPSFLRNLGLRAFVFLALMGFMITRIISSEGIVDEIGMVFVTMCILTTSISILFGAFLSPRAWCTFCPMGTLQRYLGRGKYQLNLDEERCIYCDLCKKVCPMQLEVGEIAYKPDCIKCGRCVETCPEFALSF